MITKSEIRLECLKLAHAHGREIPQVIERAEAYEKFVDQEEPKTQAAELKADSPQGKKPAIKANQKSGNFESLI